MTGSCGYRPNLGSRDGRVEDWRAGLGRSLYSLFLALSFASVTLSRPCHVSSPRRVRLIPLSQVTPFRFFPLPGWLATSTESQRRGRPSWVAKDLTHPQRPSNRLRDPLWPSPESTG